VQTFVVCGMQPVKADNAMLQAMLQLDGKAADDDCL
jgi:hypothetical protein